MSDRNLVTYEEPADHEGPNYTLRIDRSAAGAPGLLFTIEVGGIESTVIVKDGRKLLEPVTEWLVG